MIDPNQPVRVFLNWKHGCWSIMQRGALRASAREVRIVDVQFVVRESGRQRMLRENKRNVHAYVHGWLEDWVHPDDARALHNDGGRGVIYFPRGHASFIDVQSQAPIWRARSVHLNEHGVTYLPEALVEAA